MPLRSSLQESSATIPDLARAPPSAIAGAHTDGRLRLSGRQLRSQPFLPASAKKAFVKISHRDAAANYARHWRARARVVSSRDGQAPREFVREIARGWRAAGGRSEEHTSELQSRGHLVCRLLLEKKNN